MPKFIRRILLLCFALATASASAESYTPSTSLDRDDFFALEGDWRVPPGRGLRARLTIGPADGGARMVTLTGPRMPFRAAACPKGSVAWARLCSERARRTERAEGRVTFDGSGNYYYGVLEGRFGKSEATIQRVDEDTVAVNLPAGSALPDSVGVFRFAGDSSAERISLLFRKEDGSMPAGERFNLAGHWRLKEDNGLVEILADADGAFQLRMEGAVSSYDFGKSKQWDQYWERAAKSGPLLLTGKVDWNEPAGEYRGFLQDRNAQKEITIRGDGSDRLLFGFPRAGNEQATGSRVLFKNYALDRRIEAILKRQPTSEGFQAPTPRSWVGNYVFKSPSRFVGLRVLAGTTSAQDLAGELYLLPLNDDANSDYDTARMWHMILESAAKRGQKWHFDVKGTGESKATPGAVNITATTREPGTVDQPFRFRLQQFGPNALELTHYGQAGYDGTFDGPTGTSHRLERVPDFTLPEQIAADTDDTVVDDEDNQAVVDDEDNEGGGGSGNQPLAQPADEGWFTADNATNTNDDGGSGGASGGSGTAQAQGGGGGAQSTADPDAGRFDMLDFDEGSMLIAKPDNKLIFAHRREVCPAALSGALCEAVKSAPEGVLEVTPTDQAVSSSDRGFGRFEAYGKTYVYTVAGSANTQEGVIEIFGPDGARSVSRLGVRPPQGQEQHATVDDEDNLPSDDEPHATVDDEENLPSDGEQHATVDGEDNLLENAQGEGGTTPPPPPSGNDGGKGPGFNLAGKGFSFIVMGPATEEAKGRHSKPYDGLALVLLGDIPATDGADGERRFELAAEGIAPILVSDHLRGPFDRVGLSLFSKASVPIDARIEADAWLVTAQFGNYGTLELKLTEAVYYPNDNPDADLTQLRGTVQGSLNFPPAPGAGALSKTFDHATSFGMFNVLGKIEGARIDDGSGSDGGGTGNKTVDNGGNGKGNDTPPRKVEWEGVYRTNDATQQGTALRIAIRESNGWQMRAPVFHRGKRTQIEACGREIDGKLLGYYRLKPAGDSSNLTPSDVDVGYYYGRIKFESPADGVIDATATRAVFHTRLADQKTSPLGDSYAQRSTDPADMDDFFNDKDGRQIDCTVLTEQVKSFLGPDPDLAQIAKWAAYDAEPNNLLFDGAYKTSDYKLPGSRLLWHFRRLDTHHVAGVLEQDGVQVLARVCLKIDDVERSISQRTYALSGVGNFEGEWRSVQFDTINFGKSGSVHLGRDANDRLSDQYRVYPVTLGEGQPGTDNLNCSFLDRVVNAPANAIPHSVRDTAIDLRASLGQQEIDVPGRVYEVMVRGLRSNNDGRPGGQHSPRGSKVVRGNLRFQLGYGGYRAGTVSIGDTAGVTQTPRKHVPVTCTRFNRPHSCPQGRLKAKPGQIISYEKDKVSLSTDESDNRGVRQYNIAVLMRYELTDERLREGAADDLTLIISGNYELEEEGVLAANNKVVFSDVRPLYNLRVGEERRLTTLSTRDDDEQLGLYYTIRRVR